jgi:phosphopantothenoylcysteine decarboxylase
MQKNLLVAVTGSVATIKLLELLEILKNSSYNIKIITTEKSRYFLPQLDFQVLSDANEWENERYSRGDQVLHIELRKWADGMIVSPLSANTLAKMANGICDNLLTCVLRAWDPTKPLLVAPAMNTMMWDHPLTSRQLNEIKSWGFVTIIEPIVKLLACGDYGNGAMASVEVIAEEVQDAMNLL